MDPWEPTQYERFLRERRQPWDDLVGLCRQVPGGTVVDLGCGTGRLTAELPERLQAASVTGVDSSAAMLAEATALQAEGLRFEEGDLTTWSPAEPVDVAISNAALQWVDHHDRVLRGWRRHLRTDGQLALQVPANGDHPANALVAELSQEHASWFPGGPPPLVTDTVLTPERYATMLWHLGATESWVGMRVYLHEMASPADVVEWLKGTTLNRVRQHLESEDRFAAFLELFEAALLGRLGDERPYLYTFKRILLWARFP